MATPMTLTFDSSVTAQQKQWTQEAINRSRFPFNAAAINVTVLTVAEPPCPGHSDYMCTETDGAGNASVYIRQGADQLTSPINAGAFSGVDELQRFFEESIIHEIVGHGFTFNHLVHTDTDRTTIAGWFRRNDTAQQTVGTLADWNPADKPWEDRIQEGVAEFLKDVYLAEQYREFENRTHWDFQEQFFPELLTLIEATTCVGLS